MQVSKSTLQEDLTYYTNLWKDDANVNNIVYQDFLNKTNSYDFLAKHVEVVHRYNLGYGEPAFRYLWLLLFNQIPNDGKFLEIGVFKGSILALSQLCAQKSDKVIECYGITPLSPVGDKYSQYANDDYDYSIAFLYHQLGLNLDHTNIIQGLSTDSLVKKAALANGPYDVVYIDGGHDYETVLNDIELSDSLLKPNGFLVLDDASSDLQFFTTHPGFPGHADVARAVRDDLSKRTNYRHLFACGHNRVWIKEN
tara:strand:- start:506 stop:1264 length:759 start_codon:yes stop_codon:yes gene_type:complete